MENRIALTLKLDKKLFKLLKSETIELSSTTQDFLEELIINYFLPHESHVVELVEELKRKGQINVNNLDIVFLLQDEFLRRGFLTEFVTRTKSNFLVLKEEV